MNDDMKLFNGDIVIDSYSFVQNNNKQYFKSLVCGFIRRDINEYIIPDDIAYKCAKLIDYGSFPVQQLLHEKHHSFLSKLLNKGLNSTNNKRLLSVVQLMRKIVTNEDPEQSIQSLIDEGIIPKLLQFLQSDNINCELQVETVWTFVNVSAGTKQQTQYTINIGAVPALINLLNSKSLKVQEQAIWALGNIAGNDVNARNIVLRHDALSLLFPLFDENIQSQQQLNILRHATWTLSNFCRGKPSPGWIYIELAVKALSIMIKSDDDEILQDACWAFSYLTDVHSNEEQLQIREIINSGSVNILIELLNHSNAHIRHPSLRAVGNIVSGGYEETECVIKLGLLEKMKRLMCDKAPIKREACWTLSNITAGAKEQIESVIKANLIQPLIHILKNEVIEVSQEALWAISNITNNGTDVQINVLVNEGVIEPLCKCINPLVIKSIQCLVVSLEAVENILAVGLRISNGDIANNVYVKHVKNANGVDYLEQIQAKQEIPDEIRENATVIIKTYFQIIK